MEALLNHPAIQAGFAPFLVALVTSVLFHRIKLGGLAIIAGFATTVFLVSDFNFVPLTSTRKIVLCGLAASLFAIPLSMMQTRWIKLLLPLSGGAAIIWVAYRILQQQEMLVMVLWGSACVTYVGIVIWGMDQLARIEPLRAASAATALGIGTGAAALIGASALLGQFGLAIGSAAAAHLLFLIFASQTHTSGRIFTFPVALIAAMTACIAVISAELPWYALIALGVIPLSAKIIPLHSTSGFVKTLQLLIPTFALASITIFLTWRAAGDVPF